MWRTISLVIIGFWLVMTSLLVRYVWFPEGTHFSEVPPEVVLREFLDESSRVNTASILYIFHGDQKIGQATLKSIRVPPSVGRDFVLYLTGHLEPGAVQLTNKKVSWSLNLKVLDGIHFDEIGGRLQVEGTPQTVKFRWQKKQRLPNITVEGGEEAGINDMMIQLAMAQALSGGMPPETMSSADGSAAESESALDTVRVRARESAMVFAGQKSHGYLLELTVMDRWKARAFITEAGEFVLMDLPEGYRLVEPVIHGLAPDYDEEEDAEKAKGKSDQ